MDGIPAHDGYVMISTGLRAAAGRQPAKLTNCHESTRIEPEACEIQSEPPVENILKCQIAEVTQTIRA
jgi:hypothetical protein